GRYPDVDAVGGKDQQIAPQKDKGGIKKQRDADTGREHIEGGIALVHEHLVNDQLEEYRRRQPKRVQKQHCHGHVQEKPSLARDFRQEPAEAEGLVRIVKCIAALGQNQFAPPAFAELLQRQDEAFGARGERIEKVDDVLALLALPGSKHNDPIAVLEKSQGGIGAAQPG